MIQTQAQAQLDHWWQAKLDAEAPIDESPPVQRACSPRAACVQPRAAPCVPPPYIPPAGGTLHACAFGVCGHLAFIGRLLPT
jgi:hypothetical protein